MKRRYAFIVLALAIILTSCQAGHKTEPFGKTDKEIISLDYDVLGISSFYGSNAEFMCLAAPKPIEEIAQKAYIIVKARLEKTEEVELDYSCSLGTLPEYEFTINEFLKGSVEDEKLNLQMYSIITNCHDCGNQKKIFEEGGEYILFIRKRQSIYQGDSYSCDSLIFGVQESRIVSEYQHGDKYDKMFFRTVEDFKDYLAKVVEDTESNGGITGCGYIETEEIRDIVEFSHVIAKVRIKEYVYTNEENNLSSVKIENVETYKGEMPETMNVILFNEDVNTGKEAIILLTNDLYENGKGYTYAVSSRNSVIYEDDARFKEYQAYIGLDSLLNGGQYGRMGFEYSYQSPKEAEGDILICDLYEKNYIDIEGVWELEWEAAERASANRFNYYKDFSDNEEKDAFTFSRDGSGFFKHKSSKQYFNWSYLLKNGRKIGAVLDGDEIRPQKIIFLGPEEDGFVFSWSFTDGSDKKYGANFIRKAGLKKTSHHIRIVSDEGIYIPRAYSLYSCRDGICADMIPFYMLDEPVSPKVYKDADIEITASGGEGGKVISFRIYDSDYMTLSGNSDKLIIPEEKGEYTVRIIVSWGTKEEYDGYEFLMGLNIE